ncbi:glycoside hydrolase family 9 protein [Amycolatopsis sp. cg5]|uniref:glycoside hydrolase family 9 protein n=1 Tax=Amycolatopsis sp. cg5 TaxID=3238802 RepID=UPI0035252A5B
MNHLGRRSFLLGSAGVAGAAALPGTASATEEGGAGTQVMANAVGYEAVGPKRVIFASQGQWSGPGGFRLVDNLTGAVVFRGQAKPAVTVEDWRKDQFPEVPDFYRVGDFSSFTKPGEYVVVADNGGSSWPFRIEQNLLERFTLPAVVHFFKESRSSGQFDKADRSLAVGTTGQRWDAHGGWYDAAADWGKHFTQLSGLSYFNTLSIPLTAWVLFAAHGNLDRRKDKNFVSLTTWLLDEAFFGADYLVRTHVPGKSFYSGVSQPEDDFLDVDPTLRKLNTKQVNYREGGGAAIAALARASTYGISGEYTPAEYLAAAKDAFTFLQANNTDMTNDKKENIQDDYNALLAATELFKATKDAQYQQAADARATSLTSRLASWQKYRDYWRADAVDRPYFHPSDAGLPVVSLLSYVDIAGDAVKAQVLAVVRKSLEFELGVTAEVPNPFGYARQLIQGREGNRYTGFFMPHDIAPRSDDIWWQGENARIASLASAARHAARYFDDAFAARLRAYAQDQLNWILGVNPYATCMLEGPGRSVPLYLEYANDDPAGSWRWLRWPGGIVNGITGKGEDGRGLQWDPGRAATGPNTDWRWLEQWLPHATWYLHAVTARI